MRYIFILLIFLAGCATPNYDPYSGNQPGTMYHYSGSIYFDCSKCDGKSNLFRLDSKDRVICQECFKKSNKKWLYH